MKNPKTSKKIAILGGGSWGTALAIHLAKNQHSVRVWEFVEDQAKEMQLKRVCPLLSQAKLPENIFVSSKMEEVIPESEVIFVVVPSDKVEVTIKNAARYLGYQPVIICSKGLSIKGELLTEVVKPLVKGEVYCLYGPTHAEEVCHGKFSGIVLAGGKGKLPLKRVIESDNLRVELSNDLIGVQIAAALKNILAILVGMVDGAGLGDNTRAYVITKGLAEIQQIGLRLGAKKETFYGLAGIGDVIVTCTSVHSRNHHVGEQIGKGRKLNDVLAEMKMVAEGVTTLKQAVSLQKKLGLELPIISGAYKILFEDKPLEEVIKEI
ncbi:MAG: NAD(P)H-dependent glycerol-3-phosphate dehydrogenase [Candidatus Woesearchaeota archaeon]|jgi:glycerol-3-phosphate dehydrogenase (NAD(P)+)